MLSINQFANIINVFAIALVLIVSSLVSQTYSRNFFRFWIYGYFFDLSFVLIPSIFTLDFVSTWPLMGLVYLEVALIVIQSAFFFSTGFSLLEKRVPIRILVLISCIAFISSVAALSFGVLPKNAIVIPFLLSTSSWVFLGMAFIRISRVFKGLASVLWLGVPLCLIGILPLFYPLASTQYHWIFYSIAALLHVLVGTGMIVFLLEKKEEDILRLQAEKIASLKENDRIKDEFLSIISHEIRSPLTSILGYIDLLANGFDGELSESQSRHIGKVQQGAKVLLRLVDDILDYSKLESKSLQFRFSEEDLYSTIEDITGIILPRLRKAGIALEAVLPDEPLMIQMDSGRVGQVLTNFLENALKHTSEGGQITVTVEENSQEVTVKVHDSGAGIPEGDLPKVFSRYYQVDSAGTRRNKGVGLGLSIAKAIVEAHGGEIGVDSMVGEGSTFWFSLPRIATPSGIADSPAKVPVKA